jgi:hypothetical protein
VSSNGFGGGGVTSLHITEAIATCRQIGMPKHQEMAEALLSDDGPSKGR